MRNPKSSVVRFVAADKPAVEKAAGFIGCSRRFDIPVLKHFQSWRRQTVSIAADTKLFA
jgi:hypothetical protein